MTSRSAPRRSAEGRGADLAARPLPGRTGSGGDHLTPREREVLAMLVEGKAMKEVAAVLGITARTVACHEYQMMETLGIRSSAELVRYAVDRATSSGTCHS